MTPTGEVVAPTVEREFLIRTPVGDLRVGDAFHARRVGLGRLSPTTGKPGGRWLQARTVDREAGRWVTGTDKNGRTMTVHLDDITLIDKKRKVWDPPEEIRQQFRPRPRKGR